MVQGGMESDEFIIQQRGRAQGLEPLGLLLRRVVASIQSSSGANGRDIRGKMIGHADTPSPALAGSREGLKASTQCTGQ
jgi:hypothetical protein